MGRVLVVDVLRGLAIALMVLQHTPAFLLADPESDINTYGYILSRLSAPLFLTIIGYCVVLSARRRVQSIGRRRFMWHLLRRTAGLYLMGLVLNILRFEPPLTVNILHLAGFSVLSAGLIYLGGSRLVYVVILGLLVFYSYTVPATYSSVLLKGPVDLLVWFMSVGPPHEYPLGPWLIYSVIGLGVAWFYPDMRPGNIGLVFLGEALILLSIILTYSGWVMDVRSNSITYMSLILGSVSIIYYVFSHIGAGGLAGFLTESLALYGRHPLPMYFSHIVVLFTAPHILGLQHSFDASGVLAVTIGYFLTAYLVLRLLEGLRGRVDLATGEGTSGCT